MSGCTSDDESTLALVDPSVFTTYSDPSGVFSIELPPGWIIKNASTEFAIDIGFSPPGSAVPLVGVYIATIDSLGQGPDETTPALETFVDSYRQALYGQAADSLVETAREPQLDGSVRIKFLESNGGRQSQHNDFVQFVGPYFVVLRTIIPDEQGQLRTLNKVINTLSINQSAGWTSIEQSQPQQEVRVEPIGFGGLNAWQNSAGGFVIVGQVINNTHIPLEFVRVQAQLYDAQDNVLGLQDVFVSSDRMAPGQTAPFALIFTEGLPPGTVRYDLDASAQFSDPGQENFYGPENFGVASQSGFDQSGALVINGQVRNEGSQTAILVKVIVTILDSQGKVVGTATTLVDQQQLGTSETSGFLLTFNEIGGLPSAYVIEAEGVILP
jgi:hypothetical protein